MRLLWGNSVLRCEKAAWRESNVRSRCLEGHCAPHFFVQSKRTMNIEEIIPPHLEKNVSIRLFNKMNVSHGAKWLSEHPELREVPTQECYFAFTTIERYKMGITFRSTLSRYTRTKRWVFCPSDNRNRSLRFATLTAVWQAFFRGRIIKKIGHILISISPRQSGKRYLSFLVKVTVVDEWFLSVTRRKLYFARFRSMIFTPTFAYSSSSWDLFFVTSSLLPQFAIAFKVRSNASVQT